MSHACIGQPVSWLKLEQFHLGELPGVERAELEAHLQSCPACRECLEQIHRDEDLALKPLPAIAPAAHPGPRFSWIRWAIPALAAVAAGLLLFVVLPGGPSNRGETALPPSRTLVKGGEISLILVRERSGQTIENPTTFAPGDRFKVLFTCPAPDETFVEVVVYQDGRVSFPFNAPAGIRCANNTPLPGAFIITGHAEAIVCAVTAAEPPDRSRFPAEPPSLSGWRAVCQRMAPAR